MADPFPRIILIPGIGMIATGRDKAGADITRDIYHRTIAVIKSASTVSTYVSMTPAEAYSVEYWPLEIYKMTLAPPEKSLARRVAFVTGGASGIAVKIAAVLRPKGPMFVVADIHQPERGGRGRRGDREDRWKREGLGLRHGRDE